MGTAATSAAIAGLLLALVPTPVQRGRRAPAPEVTYPDLLIAVDAIRGHLAEGEYKQPVDVFFEAQAGELYVVDMKNALIGIYDPEGVPLFAFGGRARLVDPMELVVSPDGSIYVLDSEATRIKAFNYRGEPREPLRFFGPEASPGDPPVRISAFARDTAGRWYVGDAEGARVLVYGPDGEYRLTIPREDGVGKLGLVTGIAVSVDGLIAVIDQRETPVQVFDREGRFVSGFGSRDIGIENFTAPLDVAFDDQGYLYVVDMLRHDVKVFDTNGNFQTLFGGWFSPETRGRGPGEMLYPTGIAIAPDGRVYVAERFGNRVQIFQKTPKEPPEGAAPADPRR